MDDFNSIGARIRQVRLNAQLTQDELAQKLGISMAAVRAYENNLREPTGRILVTLEQTFGVSGAFLYGLTDNPISFSGPEPVAVTTRLDGQKVYEATMLKESGIPKEKVESMIKDATWITEQNTRRLSSNRIQRLTDRVDAQFNIIVLEALVIGLLLVCLAGLCWSGRQTPTPTADTAPATTYHITQPALAAAKAVEDTSTKQLQPVPDYNVPISADHKAAVLAACTEYGVDPLVAFAVMQVESCYDPDAENAVCVGYYQINEEYEWHYRQQLGVAGIREPLDNIQCGVWYLGQLIGRCDTLDLALMHYNLGNIADTYWAEGVTETAYTMKVRDAMRELAAEVQA